MELGCENHLFDLSDDTLIFILAKCDNIADVMAFAKVCRRGRRIAFHPSLWKSVAVPAPASGRAAGDVYASDDEALGETSSDSDFMSGELHSTRKGGRKRKARRKCTQGNHRSRRGPARPAGKQEKDEICPAAVAIEHCTSVSRLSDTRTGHGKSVLESLDLSSLSSIQGSLGRDGLEMLARRAGSSLQSFDCPPSDRLRHDDLVSFAWGCPNLRSLTLHRVSHLTLGTVGDILRGSRIVRIGMVECRNIRGGAPLFWRAIAAVAGQLESIDITGCSITALPLKEMMQHCKALLDFTADRCMDLIPPSVMPSVVQADGRPLAGFQSLAWLRLDFASGNWSPFLSWLFMQYGLRCSLRALSLNARVGALGLIPSRGTLAMDFPPLEHLALSGQMNLVDDKFFCDVIIGQLSKYLRTLDLSKSSSLAGNWDTSSEWHFPNLEQLDLSLTKICEVCWYLIMFLFASTSRRE